MENILFILGPSGIINSKVEGVLIVDDTIPFSLVPIYIVELMTVAQVNVNGSAVIWEFRIVMI